MTLYYPDAASMQANMNLTGLKAIAEKATQGTTYKNPYYSNQKNQAAAKNIFFFAYHFLNAGNAKAQAAWAFKNVGRTTPLMLDFEPWTGGKSYPTMFDAITFVDEFKRLGGRTHLLYLPRWYWSDPNHVKSASLKPFTDRDMVLVSSHYTTYTDANTGAGWQPYGGVTPTVWQFSSTTPFAGLRIDFNAFRGSKYAGKQDTASVAACLTEFKSIVRTGKYPVVQPVINPPTVSFTVASPRKVYGDASASTAGSGTVKEVRWGWGDETGHFYGVKADHVYAQHGTYTVTVQVTNSYGKVAQLEKTIVV